MTDISQLKITEQERNEIAQRIRQRESDERVKAATAKTLSLLVDCELTIRESRVVLSEVYFILDVQSGRPKVINPQKTSVDEKPGF